MWLHRYIFEFCQLRFIYYLWPRTVCTSFFLIIFFRNFKNNWTNHGSLTCVQGLLPSTPCQIWACVYLFGTPLQEDTRASRATPPKLIATRRQSDGTVWPGNIKPSDSIREAMRELGQRCSNVVSASMIMAQHWGSNVSLPSAKCYLYSLSHNYSVYNWIIQSNIATSDYKLNN